MLFYLTYTNRNIFIITEYSSSSGCSSLNFLAVLITNFNDLRSNALFNGFDRPSLHSLYSNDIFFDNIC